MPDNKLNRVVKWDNMKFLLIFCVVIGHISEMYTGNYIWFKRLFLFIYVFHMPAFLLVSGLFSKKTVKERRFKTIFSYLISYFVIKILRNGIHYVVYGKGSFSILSESGVAWYAGVLFAYCIITILVEKVQWKYALTCAVVLSCFAGYDSSIGDWLILSRIIVYYPFFLIGYLIDPNKLGEIVKKTSIKVMSGIWLMVITVLFLSNGEKLYWLRPLLTGRNPYSKLELFSEMGGLLRFIYYFAVITIIFAVVAIVPNIKLPVLTGIGERSLSVYVFHLCVIDIIWGVVGFGEYMRNNMVGVTFYIGMFLMAFLIMWLTSLPVFERFMRYLITPKLRS